MRVLPTEIRLGHARNATGRALYVTPIDLTLSVHGGGSLVGLIPRFRLYGDASVGTTVALLENVPARVYGIIGLPLLKLHPHARANRRNVYRARIRVPRLRRRGHSPRAIIMTIHREASHLDALQLPWVIDVYYYTLKPPKEAASEALMKLLGSE